MGLNCFMKISALAIAVGLAHQPAMAEPAPDAEPFGLRMGTSQAEFKKQVPDAECESDRICTFENPPTPLGLADVYSAVFTESTGLCKVTAVVGIENTSVYGDEVRSTYDRLLEALSKRYGEPSDSFDMLRAGSIWKDARDWMTALSRKERTLSAYWMRSESNALPRLPANLQSIGIDTRALSQRSGAISVGYEFANFDECIKEIRGAQLDGL